MNNVTIALLYLCAIYKRISMRRILLMLVLIVGALPIMAQNVLNVHSKTGAVVSYAFSEKPVVTYDGDVLVLKTEKVSVEYPLSDLEKFTFGDTESAVESISASGISGDRSISIFDMSGRSVKTISADEGTDSDPRLLLNNLEKGIYIVKQGEVSYKIIKE